MTLANRVLAPIARAWIALKRAMRNADRRSDAARRINAVPTKDCRMMCLRCGGGPLCTLGVLLRGD